MGRNDSPTVEQVLRAALYKEIFRLNYRELEYAEKDSKICELFLKLHRRNVFSFQVLQKYISAILPESLRRVMVELNRIALEELNLSSDIIKRLRVDTTVVESNIHYPTDNSLIWDCIRKLDENMKKLSRHLQQQYRSECKQAKKNFFKINVEKKPQKRKETFEDQLKLFISYMKRAEQQLREISHWDIGSMDREVRRLVESIEELLPMSRKIYDVAYQRIIEQKAVPASEKIISIFEPHTDIIVKGNREVKFGHKVSVATRRENLILDCEVYDGNISDRETFPGVLQRMDSNYGRRIESLVTDGGYASGKNLDVAHGEFKIKNVVFNKTVGRLKSMVQSKTLETQLKKWRSGIEGVISNIKRRFELRRCVWKGRQRFESKVFWSVIAYNVRVMSAMLFKQIQLS